MSCRNQDNLFAAEALRHGEKSCAHPSGVHFELLLVVVFIRASAINRFVS